MTLEELRQVIEEALLDTPHSLDDSYAQSSAVADKLIDFGLVTKLSAS